MELVKTNIENKELQNLLYRKEVLEGLMERNAKTISVYSDYVNNLKKEIENPEIKELDKCRLSIELDKVEWELRNFVTQFKNNQREYKHAVKVRVGKLVDEKEKESIKFKDYEEKAKELAKIELFGKTVKLGEKTEQIEIIQSEKKYLSILEKFVKEGKKQLKNLKSFEKVKLEKEILETEIHFSTLQKRLANRVDYYENQFLPIFNEELAEANKKMSSYIDRANLIVKEGLDVTLALLLKEKSKHEDTDENTWLFYKALKNRVHAFINELKSQQGVNLKKYQHLTKPI